MAKNTGSKSSSANKPSGSKPGQRKSSQRSGPGGGDSPAKSFFIGATVIVGGLLVLNLYNSVPRGGTEVEHSVPENVTRKPLSDAEARSLAPFLDAVWDGKGGGAVPASLKKGEAAVFVEARANGQKVGGGSLWREGKTGEAALKSALQAMKKQLKDKGDLERADTLVLFLAHSFQTIDVDDDSGKISNVRRGLRGIEFIAKDKPTRVSPTEMLATNRDFKMVIERFEQSSGLGDGATKRGQVRTRTFEGDQMLFFLKTAPRKVEPMFRGNQLITMEEVTKDSTQVLADALSDYLFHNLQPDGRQIYIWWPSVGDEPNFKKKNNMIRQWMATVAMGRVARKNDEDPSNDDTEQLSRVATNIDYNLAQFFHEEPLPADAPKMSTGDTMGLIEFQGKVKLGAIALTALSIAEHPARERWQRQEQAIQRTINALWRDDGYMKSFMKPSNYRDFHNFYPGEALLYWSTLLEKDGLDVLAPDGEKLLDKFMKSVWYFKDWHLANRNPAFIPWHTQAYYKVWKLTGDKKILDWTMEMNDWLLRVQDWEDRTQFPDVNGRFYSKSPNYGPPHASSTGVYLEGLIFAWLMAKETGQTERQEKYRQAIMRGLRSCMQLTFFDEIDMYYVSKRDVVRGGVRETVYDNEIRVDNVQHNLMGQLNILRYMEPGEFRP
jgi:hypothetical protein